MRTRIVKLGWLSFVLAVSSVSGIALAQPAPESRAAAEALFDEGKKLMNAGDYARACEKFEQSDRLDPAIGTELNLAACFEKSGRTASAWATFRRAAAMAKAKKQVDREKLARERADALEPKLARLTLVVNDKSGDLQITRNGVPISNEVWGQPVPIDPGKITVEAKATGKKTWTGTVDVAESATQSLAVPVLEDDPNAPAPPPITEAPAPAPAPVVTPGPVAPPPQQDQPPPGSSDGSGQRTAGLVVGGIGLVALGVSGFFGLRAMSKNDESKDHCLSSDSNRCDAEGVSLRDDARSAGNIATVAGGLGLAAVIGGAALYFTAPKSNRTEVGFVPARHGAAFSVRSAW